MSKNTIEHLHGLTENQIAIYNKIASEFCEIEIKSEWFDIDNTEYNTCFNTYNVSSVEVILEYSFDNFFTVAFHLGGDVRGNYSKDYVFINKEKSAYNNDMTVAELFEDIKAVFETEDVPFIAKIDLLSDASNYDNYIINYKNDLSEDLGYNDLNEADKLVFEKLIEENHKIES